MKNGLVIADKLWILDKLFDEIRIPQAVWNEITLDKTKPFISKIKGYFAKKVHKIKGFNELTFVMDYGESESVILYRESQADFLLIDDKKARKIAENFGIQCIGTIGLLSISKDKGIIDELRPIFKSFIENKRFYSQKLLNTVLESKGEKILNY